MPTEPRGAGLGPSATRQRAGVPSLRLHRSAQLPGVSDSSLTEPSRRDAAARVAHARRLQIWATRRWLAACRLRPWKQGRGASVTAPSRPCVTRSLPGVEDQLFRVAAHLEDIPGLPGATLIEAFEELLTRPLIAPLARPPRLWLRLLVRLAYPDSQRAEYEADRLAAHTAGTRAAVAALTLAHLGPAYAAQASGLAINAERDFFPAWRTLVERMSERERQRLGRVVRLDATRLDPTLPTSASRLRALRAHQVSVPAVGLSASESARIDAELAPLERPLQVALADRMASALS